MCIREGLLQKNEDTSKTANNGYMVPKNVKESKDPLKIKKAEAMQNNIDGNKKLF